MKNRIVGLIGWMVMSLGLWGQDFVLSNPGMTDSPVPFPGGRQTISFDFYILQQGFTFSSLPASPDHASIAFSFTKLDPSASKPTGDGADLFDWKLVNTGGTGADLVYTWMGTSKDVTMEPSPPRRKYKIIFREIPASHRANKYESDITVDAKFTDPVNARPGSFGNNRAKISTYSVDRNCGAGVDFADLPAKWPAASARVLSGDCNSDGIPDGPGASVWAGAGVNVEPLQKFSDRADADEYDDGLLLPPAGVKAGQWNDFQITLSSNVDGTMAYYGLWFDWNNDGNFMNDQVRGQSSFYAGNKAATYNGTLVAVPVLTPDKVSQIYKVRLIVSAEPLKRNDFMGTIANGEVEDYEVNAGNLPLRFVQSDAIPNNGRLLVNWKVENQFNAASYEIEIGRDPQRFSKIADAEASDIENEYRSDVQVDAGLRAPLLYVRVKALDKNGGIHYSRVMTVVGLHQAREPLSVTLFPNPIVESRRLTIQAKTGIFNGRYRIVVVDMQGKQMFAFERELINLKNFAIEVPGGLAAGNYRMSIINSDLSENVVVEFMKL